MTVVDLNNIIGENISMFIFLMVLLASVNSFIKESKYKKLGRFLQKIVLGVIIFWIFKLIYLIIWSYNYEPPLNETRKFLNETTDKTEVYIDGLKVVEPQFIISKLKKAKNHVLSHGHSYPNKQTKEYIMVIKNADKSMNLKLKQDTQWKWEYSIYNLYLDETLGDTRTIFNAPIKVIKDGKIIEKQF